MGPIPRNYAFMMFIWFLIYVTRHLEFFRGTTALPKLHSLEVVPFVLEIDYIFIILKTLFELRPGKCFHNDQLPIQTFIKCGSILFAHYIN